MAQPLPNVKVKYFDSNGLPLAGGKLYSYAAGTSTPQNTYTDNTELTQNANPTILDANGEANVWIGALGYKFTLKNSLDVVQWTVDGIYVIPPGAVTTVKIADGAVTTAKAADGFLSADTLGRAKMADGFVTGAKLYSGIVDGSTLEIAAGVLRVKAAGITRPKLAALGQQTATLGSPFTVSATSEADVTGLSVTLTTTGRPVLVLLYGASISVDVANPNSTLTFSIKQGSTYLATYTKLFSVTNLFLPATFMAIDTPAAGTYTYKIRANKGLFDDNAFFQTSVKITAYEL